MSSMMIESVEQAHHHDQNGQANSDHLPAITTPKKWWGRRWWLLLLYCACTAVGAIAGPLLQRLYYIHGGNRKWFASCVQSAGFPLLLIPLLFLYFRSPKNIMFFMDTKLFLFGVVLGTINGLGSYMYSMGLRYIPVSTSSLLFSTQLVFTALFAFLLVKQKFSFYSINSIVVMVLGAALLGLHTNADRPAGVSTGKYMFGFFVTVVAAALLGVLLPLVELGYSKSRRPVTYIVVMQFQVVLSFFSTIFCTIGMLINKDFQIISREAREYELGEGKYYIVISAGIVIWQVLTLGLIGIIHSSSSLFAGIFTALLLPLTEVAAVMAFHEKFTGEKGLSLVLCLWGLASYFTGEYKKTYKKKPPT